MKNTKIKNNENLNQTHLSIKKNNLMTNFKIIVVTFMMVLFAVTNGIAQKDKPTVKEVEYKNGQFEIQAGVGLIPMFSSAMISPNTKTRVLPVNVVLNYRVNKAFNIGAYLGYYSAEYNKEGSIKELPPQDLYLINDFYLTGLRFEGHFNRERIDFYGGAMLGYNFSKIKTNIENPLDRPEGVEIGEGDELGTFTYSGYVGLKYALTPNVGIYGEVGYGVALVSLGGSYRF